MKKIFAVFLAVLMLALALTGCGNDKDTNEGSSNKSNHVVDYHLDIPDGFVASEMEGLDGFWFRTDGSNINLGIAEKDSTSDLGFSMITADILRTTLEEEMQSAYGQSVNITDRYFTKNEVSGLPAYQYSYNMVLDGQTMMQIIVCINADKVYTFTFTAIDAETLALFDTCAKNIRLTVE